MAKWKLDRRKAWDFTKQYLIMLLITFKWIFVLGLLVGIFGGAAAFGYVTALVKDEPIRDKATIYGEMQKNTLTGFVYFKDGTPVGQLRGIDRRLIDDLDDVPTVIQNAFLAVEDSEFENHIGINVTSLMRAVKERVLNEDIQTGGSTITQQVARNVFLSLDRTDARKVKEIFLAIRLERVLTKTEIFLAYLNKVPFGNGSSGYNVYGIKAAAEGIFELENLDHINIAQAAYLAGLPKNPSGYSAFDGYGRFDEKGFEKALERQKFVLRRMLTTDKITSAQYEQALAFDIRSSIAEPRAKAYSTYPFLMIEAEKKAAEMLLKQENPSLTENDFRSKEYAQIINNAREDLLGKGYRIYTTIDKDLYEAMQKIAANAEYFTPDHPEKGIEQVGAIAIHNQTGAILGMIEGRDFYEEQLNHATQMIRQPGSAMKPIAAFLPALESGDIQPASIIDDSPLILQDGSKGYHLPNNWNYRFHGLITARHALNQSYNIPALKLFNEVVTIEKAWDFTRSLGITTLTEGDNHARTGVIGGLEVGTSVEELTNAFSAIPNKGVFLDAYMIERIEDSDGNIIYQHEPDPQQVFSEETAFIMTDMLKSVISSGTGTTIRSSFKNYGKVEVAGKTGSTQRDHDMWFVGYSPQISVGVWTGYDQPATIEYNHGASHRAKNIWSIIMDTAIELKPDLFVEKFEQPKDVVRSTVSSASGLLPSPLAKQMNRLNSDFFNRKYLPIKEDDALKSYTYVRYKGLNYLPNESTPADMLREDVLIMRELNIYELLQEIDTILKKLPASARPKRGSRDMRVEDYYPIDIAMTAPMVPLPDLPNDGPPIPPTGVTVSKTDNRFVIEFKQSPSEDVIGYRLYRSSGEPEFQRVGGVGFAPGDHLAFYQDLNTAGRYIWYLTAVDIHGNESEASEFVFSGDRPPFPTFPDPSEDDDQDEDIDTEDPSTTPEPNQNNASVPAKPQNIAVSSEDGLTLQISWSANASVDGVNQYEIYYSATENGEFAKIGQTNTTQFQYISIPIEGYYRIVAVNSTGSSQPSSTVRYQIPESN